MEEARDGRRMDTENRQYDGMGTTLDSTPGLIYDKRSLDAERLFGSSLLFCEQQCYAKKAYVDSGDLRDLERTLYEHKMAHIDRVLDRWRS